VAKLSGRYTDEFCAIFARCLGQAIRALPAEVRARPDGETVFTRQPYQEWEVPTGIGLGPKLASLATADGGAPFVMLAEASGSKSEVDQARKLEAKHCRGRDAFAERLRGSASGVGQAKFSVTASVRTAMVEDQWADPELRKVGLELKLKAKDTARQENADAAAEGAKRLAADQGVEILRQQSSTELRWVPIVPEGGPQTNLSWKAFFFELTHCGPLGGHRKEADTVEMLERLVWWETMKVDIHRWVDSCWTCIQFRRRSQKVNMKMSLCTAPAC
jgi:hypothetical protein